MHPEDKEKTAVSTGTGLWQFNVMPFGLCNAPLTFERLMETVLQGLTWKTCLVYLDDVIILGKTFEGQLKNIEQVFNKLRAANLRLSPKKWALFQKEVPYLGHIISADGIRTDPEKTEAVRCWPVPRNQHEIRSFLGLCSYYRKFIKNFAQITRPLHQLTENGRLFEWSEDCATVYEKLERVLSSSPVLSYPKPGDMFIHDTDASNTAIGAVLSQLQDGEEKVIAYYSRVINSFPQKLNAFRTVWDSVTASDQTLTNPTARLLKEESRMTATDDETTRLALQVNALQVKLDEQSLKSTKKKSISEIKRNTNCNYCKKKGHWAQQCRSRIDDAQKNKNRNSSASMHMTNQLKYFSKLEKLDAPVLVTIANDKVIEATAKGTISLQAQVDNKRHNRVMAFFRDLITMDQQDYGSILTPDCYQTAIQSNENEEWTEAMKQEMESLIKNDTWELVPKPKDHPVIDNKTILPIAIENDMKLRQFDVQTAFLYGDLEENIYMRQPFGFRDKDNPDYVSHSGNPASSDFGTPSLMLRERTAIVYWAMEIPKNGESLQVTEDQQDKKKQATPAAQQQPERRTKIPPIVFRQKDKYDKITKRLNDKRVSYGCGVTTKEGVRTHSPTIEDYRAMIRRRALLRVISGYRTVSTEAVQVLAGIPPIHLLVLERIRLSTRPERNAQARRTERDITINEWQKEWESSSEKGSWTKKLIKNLSSWVNCQHKKTDYYVTQALSGHGSFKAYTKKIGKTDEICMYCHDIDTAEHTVFICERWENYRNTAILQLGHALTKENLIETMIESEEASNVVHDMLRKIMTAKEDEERIAQVQQ
ncbi:hypothetical protein HUJ05_001884 [Dendroctonus ponderosae]|nr:hypothetical protein HUJ05_001884 [Dendroctonus ponderosae]